MKPSIFYIEPTEKTPLVVKYSLNNKFEIIGESIPQDGVEFYQTIIDLIYTVLLTIVYNFSYFFLNNRSNFDFWRDHYLFKSIRSIKSFLRYLKVFSYFTNHYFRKTFSIN